MILFVLYTNIIIIPLIYIYNLNRISVNCGNPYVEIDNAIHTLSELEDSHAKLFSRALLFEIQMPEQNTLAETKISLRNIKQLWNFVHMVKSLINVWKSTLWKDINFEFMNMELKRFVKDLKGIIQNLIRT